MNEALRAMGGRWVRVRQRIEGSPAARRILSGAAWTFAGSMIARILQMAAVVIAARVLGKENFGAFGIIQGTVGSFGIFGGFGLGLTTNKHIAEYRERDAQKAGRIVALTNTVALATGAVAALALALSADWLASTVLAAPSLGRLLRISSLVVLFDSLNAAQGGTLAGLEAFKRNAFVTVLAAVIISPLLVGSVLAWGLEGAVWAYTAGQGVILFFSWRTASRELRRWRIKPMWMESFKESRILWSFSLPSVVSGLMVLPASWICNAIIVNSPGGYGSMGIYAAATRFTNLVMALQGMLGAALLPMLSSTRQQRSASLDYFNTLYSWVLGLMIIVPLACFPEIFSLVMGADFAGAGAQITFACVMFTGAVVAHRQGLARSLASEGIMWWSVLSNSTWGVLAVTLTSLLSHLGHIGRAAAETVAYTANTLIFLPLYVTRKLCPKHLLYSPPSALAWLATILACFAPIWLSSPWLRGLNFLVCCILLVRAFQLMWSHRKNVP